MELLAIQGKHAKICKSSISCKDENGKTCGVVTGITRFKDLQANKQILFSKALRSSGLWGSKYGLMDNVIYYDGKLFHLISIKTLEHYKEYYPEKYGDIADIIENAEALGIETLLCYL